VKIGDLVTIQGSQYPGPPVHVITEIDERGIHLDNGHCYNPGHLQTEVRTPHSGDLPVKLAQEIDEAERNAWDALSRYKFQMFGYWAAIWVHLNRLSGEKRLSPFGSLVTVARGRGFGPSKSRQHEGSA
jgi:hypothetical protein